MKQSFCRYCGKNIADLGPLSFCPNCGSRIIQEQPAANLPEQPSAYQPIPSPVYQPMQPPMVSPPYYGQCPAQSAQGVSRKGLSGGAIIGIVAGGIVLLAILAFVILRPGLFGGSYSSASANISGSWDAILRVKNVQGEKSAVQNVSALIGKDFRYLLDLQLSEDGSGTAQIIPSQKGLEKMTGLTAQLMDGKLMLTGTDSLSFSFEGNVNQKGEMLEGNFTITTPDKIVVSGTLKANKTASAKGGAVEAISPKVENTPAPPTEKAEVPTLAPATPEPSAVTDPPSIGDYIIGEWISDPYPDGMSDVFIFYTDGSCENIPTVNKDDGTLDGWKNGQWHTEEKINGDYSLTDQTLVFNWHADWSAGPRTYQIEILNENTLQLSEQYDEGTLLTIIHRIVA